MLSRACEYGLQAAIYLAKKAERDYTLSREISKRLSIPHQYLCKIMQTLVKKGILISHKGPKGGLALSKKPAEITMMDVVTAIDGTDFMPGCIIGYKKCVENSNCPLHVTWCDNLEKIRLMFLHKSLVQLVEDLEMPALN